MSAPPGPVTGLFAGRYALERVIGEGASATVHLARDTQGGTHVAIKMLRPELAESRAADRFLREIRRTAALQHPNILPVLDSGTYEGQLYLVFPYMEGGTLRHLLKRERHLEFSRIVEIARPIAEALDYAHKRGLVHRDVKPENILFTGGKACLGDFGIARALDLSGAVDDSSTSQNTIRGTPAYMSPEQAAGGTDLDGRSDVYSLGCVIYEMITGMQAFIGPTPESVISQRFVYAPREVHVYRPSAPRAIDDVLARAFVLTPADRYTNAVELVSDLERAIHAPLPEAPSVSDSPDQPLSRSALRWIVGAAAIGAAVLVIAVAARGRPSGQVRSRDAYRKGQQALLSWNLSEADSQFKLASTIDPSYVDAFLGLAQVRSWAKLPVSQWRFAAERAVAGSSTLSRRDSLLALGLLQIASDRPESACQSFADITQKDRWDFAGWFSLANCLAYDSTVVRDPRSPSGWRFRTSYHAALSAFENAFRIMPAVHRSYRGGSFEDVQRLLMTNTNSLRRGRASPPDTTRFVAYPTWQGDTLAFVPYSNDQFESLRSQAARGGTLNEAVLRQRKRFHEIATMWRAAYPGSADALHAVAASLDLLGEASAIDSLRLARSLSRDPRDQIRMGALEVWMRVKASLPRDEQGLEDARGLADSLLRNGVPRDARDARLLWSLAALRGQARRSAALAVQASAPIVPAGVSSSAPALVAYAAFGGPADSLRALQTLVVRAMNTSLPAPDRAKVDATWLQRARMLAVPWADWKPELASASSPAGQQLLAAWRRHDLPTFNHVLARLNTIRATSLRAADITMDGLYPESQMLADFGEYAAAASHMDPTLDSLSYATPQTLADGIRAATLIRSLALRADLAAHLNDHETAQTYARAVLVLWSEPDDFLKPVVARARQLAR